MLKLLLTFLVSALTTLIVIRSAGRHGHLSADADMGGPQKFHARPVPRIGGVGPFVALVFAALAGEWLRLPYAQDLTPLLLCSLPAFCAGLVEDLTKKVSP